MVLCSIAPTNITYCLPSASLSPQSFILIDSLILSFYVVRPVGSVDSNGSLEELEDALVDTLGKVLCEVRPDVSHPVVSHKLKAY